MPSVKYLNQTAPFWDFIASLEEQGIAGNNNNNNDHHNKTHGEASDNENERGDYPWSSGGWAAFPWGSVPHRGRHGHGPRHHHDGPPPPHNEATNEASDTEEGITEPQGPSTFPGEKHSKGRRHGHGNEYAHGKGHRGPHHHEGHQIPPFAGEGASDSKEGPSDGKHGEGRRHGHAHGKGHHGPHHGPHRGPSTRGGPGGGKGRGGGWGGRGRGRFHPYAMGPFGAFADMFQNQVFGGQENNNGDFHPDADIFDTPESFVVHVSLPGAKKEDVGVNWDAEKSELSIAGVVHRPGDEEFLKTLALDERKVGAFERKVRLGSRVSPASIDVDGIIARMEDGVLTVEIPKLDAGYVEIKKVDIE